MPVDWSRYPANWRDIRAAILQRATPEGETMPRCEWCGAPDRAVIVRDDPADPTVWRYAELDEMLDRSGTRTTHIILTIAHLGAPHADGRPGDKHDKHDVRPENLAALCQRCHLIEDMADHIRNRADNRRQRQIEAGQSALPGVL